MHHPQRRRVCTVIAALAAAAFLTFVDPSGPVRAEEQSYDVVLTRPAVVGERFSISGEGAMIRETAMIVDGTRKEQAPAGAGIKLTGTAEVLAVTPKGKVTKLSVTVDRCTRVSGPEEAELLPKESVVFAEADGKDTKFSRKDGELPPDASELLDLLFQLSADDSRGTDDELFGTRGKRAVGDTWPVNAKRATKDFAAEDITVAESDVSGTVKLDGVDREGGVERLRLSGLMKVANMNPAKVDWLPDGFKMEAGSMDFKFTVALPAEPKRDGTTDETMSARHAMTYSGQVPGGQAVRTEVTMQRAAQMKRTPLK
jgi:hypothetical protein